MRISERVEVVEGCSALAHNAHDRRPDVYQRDLPGKLLSSSSALTRHEQPRPRDHIAQQPG